MSLFSLKTRLFAVIVDQIQVLPSFDVYKAFFRRGDRDSMIVPE